MAGRRNMLIGIIVGIMVVGALSYATGVTKLLLSPFGSSTEYKSSESATAPELASGEWINSEPLKLKDLRGRVVLVEFWTFGCINCRNSLPFVESWHARYRQQGLTVIGVHSPEFEEEKNIESLRGQVASLGIRYPVVTDNDYQTWKAYNVEAWPTIFLLDKQGRIRWMRVGEGKYDETERVIQTLLAEKKLGLQTEAVSDEAVNKKHESIVHLAFKPGVRGLSIKVTICDLKNLPTANHRIINSEDGASLKLSQSGFSKQIESRCGAQRS